MINWKKDIDKDLTISYPKSYTEYETVSWEKPEGITLKKYSSDLGESFILKKHKSIVDKKENKGKKLCC